MTTRHGRQTPALQAPAGASSTPRHHPRSEASAAAAYLSWLAPARAEQRSTRDAHGGRRDVERPFARLPDLRLLLTLRRDRRRPHDRLRRRRGGALALPAVRTLRCWTGAARRTGAWVAGGNRCSRAAWLAGASRLNPPGGLGARRARPISTLERSMQVSSRTRWLLGALAAFAASVVVVPTALAGPPVVQPVIVTVHVSASQAAAVDQSNASARSGSANANGGYADGGNAAGVGGDASNSNSASGGNANGGSADTCQHAGCKASGGDGGNTGGNSSNAVGDTTANGGSTGGNTAGDAGNVAAGGNGGNTGHNESGDAASSQPAPTPARAAATTEATPPRGAAIPVTRTRQAAIPPT